MKKVVVVFVGLLFAVSVAACGPIGPVGPGDEDAYEDDFYPLDMSEAHGITLVHPGFGWELSRDQANDKRWQEIGEDAEFIVRVGGLQPNPYQFRVDHLSAWTVLESEELEFPGIDSPVLFVHAIKHDEGFEYGALQLSFSRHFRRSTAPFYYVITLWDYDYQFHDMYMDIFEEVMDSLVIYED